MPSAARYGTIAVAWRKVKAAFSCRRYVARGMSGWVAAARRSSPLGRGASALTHLLQQPQHAPRRQLAFGDDAADPGVRGEDQPPARAVRQRRRLFSEIGDQMQILVARAPADHEGAAWSLVAAALAVQLRQQRHDVAAA